MRRQRFPSNSLEHTPILKTIKYIGDKLVRFVPNYDVNVTFYSKFTVVNKATCEKIIAKENEVGEEILESTTPKMSKKKKRILNFVYFLLNILVIAIFMAVQLSSAPNPKESLSEILYVNGWFLLATLGCVALAMFFEQMKIAILIHRSTGTTRLNLAYKVAAIGRHYDTVTPLGTGGQPFQVIYMNRYGIRPGESISIAIGKYIVNQFIFFIFASILLIRNAVVGISDSSLVVSNIAQTLSWVGYVICGVSMILVIFISFNRHAGSSLVAWILKCLNKIKFGKFKLIKDYNKTFRTFMRTVDVWQHTMKSYSKSVLVIVGLIITAIGYVLVDYSMPFFIYSAFEGWHPEMWLQIVTFSMMIDLSSYYNPIPMGIGTADISFSGLFILLFTSAGALAWAQILWRCLFYYVYILQGLGVLSYDYFFGNKRLEKNKEFWMLPIKERIKIKLKK